MRTTIMIAATLLVSAAAAAPAFAAQDDTVRLVHTADLNLASAPGQAALRTRIGRAIESLCGSYATVERGSEDSITACRTEAKANIDRQLAALKGNAYATASVR